MPKRRGLIKILNPQSSRYPHGRSLGSQKWVYGLGTWMELACHLMEATKEQVFLKSELKGTWDPSSVSVLCYRLEG